MGSPPAGVTHLVSTVDAGTTTFMSRTTDRNTFTEKQRIQFLEKDADDFDRTIAAMNARLGKILAVCVSLLVSTSTAVLLLALNLVVKG